MDTTGFPVKLHIYDLSKGLVKDISMGILGKQIDGIWHTGLVVHGVEFFFGGGIQYGEPARTPFGVPDRVQEMGVTHIPKDMLMDYMAELSTRFNAQTYSFLHHNCNNFSDEVAQFLLGVAIPSYITGLPQEVLSSPMGALLQPFLMQMDQTMTNLSAQAPVLDLSGRGPAASAPASTPAPAPGAAPTSTSTSDDVDVDETPTTSAAYPSVPTDDPEAVIKVMVREEFNRIMEQGGMTPNEAAALAVTRVKQRQGQTA